MLTRKTDNIETSCTLGAIFHYKDSVTQQKRQGLWQPSFSALPSARLPSCLFAICMSLEKHLFKSSAHLKIIFNYFYCFKILFLWWETSFLGLIDLHILEDM